MNKLKVFLTVALTLVISVSVAFAMTMTVDEFKELYDDGRETMLSAFASPDIYYPVRFHDTTTVGGGVLATSTTIDGSTLLARDITRNVQIDMDYTGDGGADGLFTTTLPASTTLTHFMTEIGDCTMRLFKHLNTEAASTTTIIAGTGITLMESIGAAETVAGGGVDVEMKWCREANGSLPGDFTVKLTQYDDI